MFLKPKHKILIFSLLICLLLCGCTKSVEFSGGKVAEDDSHITMVLQEGETALLDSLPALKSADFSGSACIDEIRRWAQANPKLSRGWDDANRATATALMHMADVGGPRCCKRCSFLAIETAAALLKSADGIDMCEASPLCTWFPDNRECLQAACPYYPK